MRKRGWTLGVLQFPPAIHMDVTEFTTRPGVCDNLLAVSSKIGLPFSLIFKDLRECVKHLLAQGSDVAPDGSAAMYGMASVRELY